MKVWFSPYKLKFIEPYKVVARSGFLMRIQTEDFEYGYSDYFPWEEFGDASVEQALIELTSSVKSDLLKKSFFFAMKDGQARAEKRWLLEGVSDLTHHKLVTNTSAVDESWVDRHLEQGFQSFKLKVGSSDFDKKSLTHFFKKPCKVRLDFNGKMTEDLLSLLHEHKDMIEFIEDPCSDPKSWNEYQKKIEISFAYDQPPFDSSLVDAPVKIIKPAKQNYRDDKSRVIVFTSYLDHPVGIAHACAEARDFGEQKVDYGLMSYNVYEPSSFHSNIKTIGTNIHFEEGYGVGFNDLWEVQQWQPLVY